MTESPAKLALFAFSMIAIAIIIAQFSPKISDTTIEAWPKNTEKYVQFLENDKIILFTLHDNLNLLKKHPDNRRLWKYVIKQWVKQEQFNKELTSILKKMSEKNENSSEFSANNKNKIDAISREKLIALFNSATNTKTSRLQNWLEFYENKQDFKTKSRIQASTDGLNWKELKDLAEQNLIDEMNTPSLKFYAQAFKKLENTHSTFKSQSNEDNFEISELMVGYAKVLLKEKKWGQFKYMYKYPIFSKQLTTDQQIDYSIFSHDYVTTFTLSSEKLIKRLDTASIIIALLSGACWLFFLLIFSSQYFRDYKKSLFITIAFIASLLLTFFYQGLLSLKQYYIPSLQDLTTTQGDIGRLIYYFLFVAIPEEFFKLLIFTPFAFILPKKSSAWAFFIAASIGLGFAANENMMYFEQVHSSSLILSRFLSSSFLHISLTALIGLSFYEAIKISGEQWTNFNQTLLLMIALHGAYDFMFGFTFLGDGVGSYISMALFVYTAQLFFRQALHFGQRKNSLLPLRFVFTLCLSLTIGAAIVYGSQFTDVFSAVDAMIMELLGSAVLAYMFFYEIERT